MKQDEPATCSGPLSHQTARATPQVYKLQDPYYSSNEQWSRSTNRWENEDGEVKGNDADEYYEFLEEAPRPPPPAPTPMAAPAPPASEMQSARPRRLRQTGTTTIRQTSTTNGLRQQQHRRDATYATHGVVDAEDTGNSGAFVPPSKLQEASMWSTAVEQAALERRMREASVFDGVQYLQSCHIMSYHVISHAHRLAQVKSDSAVP